MFQTYIPLSQKYFSYLNYDMPIHPKNVQHPILKIWIFYKYIFWVEPASFFHMVLYELILFYWKIVEMMLNGRSKMFYLIDCTFKLKIFHYLVKNCHDQNRWAPFTIINLICAIDTLSIYVIILQNKNKKISPFLE